MKPEYLEILCCPECRGSLILEGECNSIGIVEKGTLACSPCERVFPIRGCIPRFFESRFYADTFGPQWKTFAKTQLDSSQIQESEIRFATEIDWREEDLREKTIIELGAGAGRFVDVVSRLQPRLAVCLDASDAVDAAHMNLKDRENVFIVQADLFHPPFRREMFDFAYSIGVMHHTPDPPGAFREMVSLVKANGRVGVSLYEISLYERPNRNSLKVCTLELFWAINMWRCEFFRSITTRVPQSWFLAYCKYLVPLLHWLNKIPVLRAIRYLFPATCYKHLPVGWSMVDTHDTYATKIVHQYRHKDVFQWFLRNGLQSIVVHNGRAGWVSLTGSKTTGPLPKELQRAIKDQPRGPGQTGSFTPSSTPI